LNERLSSSRTGAGGVFFTGLIKPFSNFFLYIVAFDCSLSHLECVRRERTTFPVFVFASYRRSFCSVCFRCTKKRLCLVIRFFFFFFWKGTYKSFTSSRRSSMVTQGITHARSVAKLYTNQPHGSRYKKTRHTDRIRRQASRLRQSVRTTFSLSL